MRGIQANCPNPFIPSTLSPFTNFQYHVKILLMSNIYKKDKTIEEIALDIVRELKNAGYKKTYFVGGFVRDKLIDIRSEKPIDIDIATEARPDEIKNVFKKEKFIEIGEAFNIVIIIVEYNIVLRIG